MTSPDEGVTRSRPLTINDIARHTGLSKATVSRAMNGRDRVSEQTRARVLELLDNVEYTPAKAAQALSTGRTGLVALVIGGNRNPTALTTIAGAVEVAENAGLRVVVSVTRDTDRTHQAYVDLLRQRIVDGAILLFPSREDLRSVDVLRRFGLPLVAIEPEVPVAGLSAIYADARADGLRATEHLIELGHTRIGVGLDTRPWGEQDQLRSGYRSACRRRGLSADGALVSRHGWTHEAGWRAIDHWLSLKDSPTAALFCCDTAALGAIAAVQARGMRVPDDFAVVGYDDTDVLRWSSPTVTSPRERRVQLARAACGELVRHLGEAAYQPIVQRLTTELAIRESTAGHASSPRNL